MKWDRQVEDRGCARYGGGEGESGGPVRHPIMEPRSCSP